VSEPEPVAEDPAADRLLQELKAKLQQKGPSHSLIAEVHRREHRDKRKRRAARRLADHAPVQSTLTPQEVPLDIQFTVAPPEPDAREREEWFLRLPEPERERLKRVWIQQREQVDDASPVQRSNRNERLVAALIVFAAVFGAGTHDHWHATLGAGICCGIWWRYLAPDRFMDPVTAIGCFFTAHLLAWGVGGGDPPQHMFMDALLLVSLAAVVGFHGEIRRSGGFDVRNRQDVGNRQN
jgi:hypothetical protein